MKPRITRSVQDSIDTHEDFSLGLPLSRPSLAPTKPAGFALNPLWVNTRQVCLGQKWLFKLNQYQVMLLFDIQQETGMICVCICIYIYIMIAYGWMYIWFFHGFLPEKINCWHTKCSFLEHPPWSWWFRICFLNVFYLQGWVSLDHQESDFNILDQHLLILRMEKRFEFQSWRENTLNIVLGAFFHPHAAAEW